jgi:hypothetical protein
VAYSYFCQHLSKINWKNYGIIISEVEFSSSVPASSQIRHGVYYYKCTETSKNGKTVTVSYLCSAILVDKLVLKGTDKVIPVLN